MKILTSLLPEDNMLKGYLAGAFIWSLTSLLGYFGVILTETQSQSLSVKAGLIAAILVAHVHDSYKKLGGKQ